jgi:ribosomal protein S18 acetylase RimI-like enzyme
MDTTFSLLQQLDSTNLARLAALHTSVMHTLLADLGPPLVLRYYEIAQKDTSVLGLCAVSPSGEIDGWALGSPAPAALNAKLRQPLGWFAGQMLRVTFTRPKVLIDLLRSLFSTTDSNLLKPAQIELTYIGVAARVQGHGLGKALLAAFSEAARQAGYTSIALSVETDNPAAVNLYTHSGFQIIKTFREGRFERHRLEYPLTFVKSPSNLPSK